MYGRHNYQIRRKGSAMRVPPMQKLSFPLLSMYLWWSYVPCIYSHACQVVVTVGDSGLCCRVCVTSFER